MAVFPTSALNRTLRVAFFGTPEFAAVCLDSLVASPHNVVGVVTAPDRRSGRGQKIQPSAVKTAAEAHSLPLLQPSNLKNPDFNEALAAWEADVFIVVAFRMLPRVVWNAPEFGTINLHASLLPQLRGAAQFNGQSLMAWLSQAYPPSRSNRPSIPGIFCFKNEWP